MLTKCEINDYDARCAKLFAEYEELRKAEMQTMYIYLRYKERAEEKHDEFNQVLDEWRERK